MFAKLVSFVEIETYFWVAIFLELLAECLEGLGVVTFVE